MSTGDSASTRGEGDVYAEMLEWLASINLASKYPLVVEQGFTKPEEFLELTKSDLIDFAEILQLNILIRRRFLNGVSEIRQILTPNSTRRNTRKRVNDDDDSDGKSDGDEDDANFNDTRGLSASDRRSLQLLKRRAREMKRGQESVAILSESIQFAQRTCKAEIRRVCEEAIAVVERARDQAEAHLEQKVEELLQQVSDASESCNEADEVCSQALAQAEQSLAEIQALSPLTRGKEQWAIATKLMEASWFDQRHKTEPRCAMAFPVNLPSDLGAAAIHFLSIVETCTVARTCARMQLYAKQALARERLRAMIPGKAYYLAQKQLLEHYAGVCPRIQSICDSRDGSQYRFDAEFPAGYGLTLSDLLTLPVPLSKLRALSIWSDTTDGPWLDEANASILRGDPSAMLPQLQRLEWRFDNMFELPEDMPQFVDGTSKFLAKWRHVPTVKLVFYLRGLTHEAAITVAECGRFHELDLTVSHGGASSRAQVTATLEACITLAQRAQCDPTRICIIVRTNHASCARWASLTERIRETLTQRANFSLEKSPLRANRPLLPNRAPH